MTKSVMHCPPDGGSNPAETAAAFPAAARLSSAHGLMSDAPRQVMRKPLSKKQIAERFRAADYYVHHDSKGYTIDCPGPNHRNGNSQLALSMYTLKGDKQIKFFCVKFCPPMKILARIGLSYADIYGTVRPDDFTNYYMLINNMSAKLVDKFHDLQRKKGWAVAVKAMEKQIGKKNLWYTSPED